MDIWQKRNVYAISGFGDPRIFPKGHCHHELKAFCEFGHNNLHKNVIANMK